MDGNAGNSDGGTASIRGGFHSTGSKHSCIYSNRVWASGNCWMKLYVPIWSVSSSHKFAPWTSAGDTVNCCGTWTGSTPTYSRPVESIAARRFRTWSTIACALWSTLWNQRPLSMVQTQVLDSPVARLHG